MHVLKLREYKSEKCSFLGGEGLLRVSKRIGDYSPVRLWENGSVPPPATWTQTLSVSGTRLSFLLLAQPLGLMRWQAGHGATEIQTLGKVQTKSDQGKIETQRNTISLWGQKGELQSPSLLWEDAQQDVEGTHWAVNLKWPHC